MLFPEEGLVYDYQLQDGGVSNSNSDGDDDDDEGKDVEVRHQMAIVRCTLSKNTISDKSDESICE